MSVEDDPWVPLRQGSVSDLIAERILHAIKSQDLQPGDRLPPERELAARLGTSRPSLREALRSLRASGHVEIKHGSGVFVADPRGSHALRDAIASEELTLTELFDMREVLEVPATAWAARNQDRELLAKVTEAFHALDRCARSAEIDWAELRTLDSAFHLRIVEAAGNRFLTRTETVLQDILARGMQTTLQLPGRLERSRRDHARIHEAVIAGDPVAARRAAKAHIDGARRAALKHLHDERSANDGSGQPD
ncbi:MULTISPECIES: FadR/GntR family transcriptional regulator [Saccharopolyspora]|uniref:GntR family transcriptional repressor for pyruvate dehydrogenase complex n=2 Tax=Saccharopolyspora TaxID=1835 RepID=A0A853AJM4_9PSEU|nr:MULTISPECIES: FadR/GntR family transcriptional regulator [Saccharopolyspora]KAA5828356.1 FadR family transcriptional regulator [Saccharopolyspora hirsuta]NYI84228.1 GntR family transcriptional repressor for pyruvate dehydrogenase complex [Saccharopolyspora hordei]